MDPLTDELPMSAWRRVVLSYAPPGKRLALAALLALDDALAAVLRTTREPMIGQMRLTWWYDALEDLADASPPAEPVLRALAVHAAGATLGPIVEGWEELLDPAMPDDGRLLRYADGRGGGLFAAAGELLGTTDSDPLAEAGRAWALADLAAHSSDPALANRALALASWPRHRFSRPARPLGAMMHLARLDRAGGGRRIGRILVHRLTGF